MKNNILRFKVQLYSSTHVMKHLVFVKKKKKLQAQLEYLYILANCFHLKHISVGGNT